MFGMPSNGADSEGEPDQPRRARSAKLAATPAACFPYLLVPVRPVVVVELRPAVTQASWCVRNRGAPLHLARARSR
jgi:hypothetical protein